MNCLIDWSRDLSRRPKNQALLMRQKKEGITRNLLRRSEKQREEQSQDRRKKKPKEKRTEGRQWQHQQI